MAEYIDRSSAIKCIESQCVEGKMWGNDETEGTLIDAYSTIDDLMEIPAADVVPVVRCIDCVLEGNCFAESHFNFAGIQNPFCCAGKRKEGAGNA